jgi:hypothetical protein
MLDEVLKVLGVEKLDEAQQTAITEKIETMVEMKARERADELLKEEKEALVEEYELKFEDYKKDITSKFSDFVDSVLDEELEIPEKVLEYAKKGELYSELIEQFKIKLAIDEGLLDNEVKGLLKEAKEEILKLKGDVNKLMAKEMELKEDAKTMAAQLYLRKKCDGLLESQKNKVYSLLGDITDKTEIDKKFKYVTENILHEQVAPGTEVEAGESAANTCVCAKCGAIYSFKGETATGPCPKCGAAMEDAKAAPDPAATDGNGQVELQPEVKQESVIVEGVESPFEKQKSTWLRMLKENKL